MTSGALLGPHAATAVELKAQIQAEREGLPFSIHPDGSGQHQIRALDAERERVTIGRRPSARRGVKSDEEVLRLHAELVRKGEDWTKTDDGLSMDGLFVNGEPGSGPPAAAGRRLHSRGRLGPAIFAIRRTTDQRPPRPRMSCAPS